MLSLKSLEWDKSTFSCTWQVLSQSSLEEGEEAPLSFLSNVSANKQNCELLL